MSIISIMISFSLLILAFLGELLALNVLLSYFIVNTLISLILFLIIKNIK